MDSAGNAIEDGVLISSPKPVTRTRRTTVYETRPLLEKSLPPTITGVLRVAVWHALQKARLCQQDEQLL